MLCAEGNTGGTMGCSFFSLFSSEHVCRPAVVSRQRRGGGLPDVGEGNIATLNRRVTVRDGSPRRRQVVRRRPLVVQCPHSTAIPAPTNGRRAAPDRCGSREFSWWGGGCTCEWARWGDEIGDGHSVGAHLRHGGHQRARGGGHGGGCEAVWKGRILPLSRGEDQHLWLARRFPSQCDLDVGEESKDTVGPYRCQRRQRRQWLESSTTRAEGGVNRDTSKRSQDSNPSDIQRRQQDARRNAPRIAIVITRLGRIFHGVSASSTSPDPDCCPVSYIERGPLRQC